MCGVKRGSGKGEVGVARGSEGRKEGKKQVFEGDIGKGDRK